MPFIRRLLPVVLCLCVLSPMALSPVAFAAPAAPAEERQPGKAEVERLLATLEDEAARKRLVEDLRGLLAAQERQQGAVEEDGLLALLAQRVEAFGEQLTAVAVVLSDVPKLGEWLVGQATDAAARGRWIEVIGKLLATVAAGFLAEQLVLALLYKPRQAVSARDSLAFAARIPLAVVRGILDLFPLAAFAAAAYGVLPLIQVKGEVRLAALLVVTAYLLARGAVVVMNLLAAPRSPGVRLLPVGDETANYLVIWAKRLLYVAVYGYFAVEAARLLGLPRSGHAFILKLLGLVVTTMLVIFTLQNRAPVADWIRRRGEGAGLGRSIQGLHHRLADVWHILAALYFIAIFGVWALQVKGGFEYVLRASLLTLLILFVAAVASAFLQHLADRGFAVSHDLRQQFPHLEARANRYLALLRTVLRGAVALITVLALLQAWGADTIAWLTSDLGRRLASSLASIGAVLIVALLVWEVATSAIERYLDRTDPDGKVVERSARARTLLPLLRNAIMVFLVIMVTLIVLAELGVNIAPLLAGAGVVGLAIGFGSQKLVQDLITGAFILFEDTISVGDVVKLGEHAGLVEAISIRTIRLRDSTGAVHTVPFSTVGTVVNMTKDFSYYVFDVGIAYREDPDQVTAILREIGAEMQQDPEFGPSILEPLEVMGVERFEASAVVVRARIKTLPIKQWGVGREFNRRMKKRFEERGIEIPFPHSTLYFGEDKSGRAPPLRIEMGEKRARRRKAGAKEPRTDEVDLPSDREAGISDKD